MVFANSDQRHRTLRPLNISRRILADVIDPLQRFYLTLQNFPIPIIPDRFVQAHKQVWVDIGSPSDSPIPPNRSDSANEASGPIKIDQSGRFFFNSKARAK